VSRKNRGNLNLSRLSGFFSLNRSHDRFSPRTRHSLGNTRPLHSTELFLFCQTVPSAFSRDATLIFHPRGNGGATADVVAAVVCRCRRNCYYYYYYLYYYYYYYHHQHRTVSRFGPASGTPGARSCAHGRRADSAWKSAIVVSSVRSVCFERTDRSHLAIVVFSSMARASSRNFGNSIKLRKEKPNRRSDLPPDAVFFFSLSLFLPFSFVNANTSLPNLTEVRAIRNTLTGPAEQLTQMAKGLARGPTTIAILPVPKPWSAQGRGRRILCGEGAPGAYTVYLREIQRIPEFSHR